jgi:hypothetical protein
VPGEIRRGPGNVRAVGRLGVHRPTIESSRDVTAGQSMGGAAHLRERAREPLQPHQANHADGRRPSACPTSATPRRPASMGVICVDSGPPFANHAPSAPSSSGHAVPISSVGRHAGGPVAYAVDRKPSSLDGHRDSALQPPVNDQFSPRIRDDGTKFVRNRVIVRPIHRSIPSALSVRRPQSRQTLLQGQRVQRVPQLSSHRTACSTTAPHPTGRLAGFGCSPAGTASLGAARSRQSAATRSVVSNGG